MSEKQIFINFKNELKRELQFQLDGGTSYRQVTSALALVTAIEIKTIESFRDRKIATQTVSDMFPTLSEERCSDVGKMLSVIAKDLYRKATLPQEIQQYVQQKKKDQTKKLGFKR